MRIKSVHIEGMHNVTSKTYTFNNVNYLVGSNGAGKSTVLEAIQLGLLGYIPGYSKTNEGTFKHARGNAMSVTLVIDDNGSDITISRTWIAAGASVKMISNIQPETANIEDIVKDIELPIFNFSEFTGLTANKLKEWFINFLPHTGDEIDWQAEITAAIDGKVVIDESLIPEIIKSANQSDASGVELVKEVNTSLKEMSSYYTGRVKSLQGTIDSLIYYDDLSGDIDEAAVRFEIEQCQELRKSLAAYNAISAQVARLEANLAGIHVEGDSFASDPEVIKCDKIMIDSSELKAELSSKIADIDKEISALRAEILSHSTLASGTGRCPYTNVDCESVKAAISEAANKCADLKAACDKKSAERTALSDKLTGASKDYSDAANKIAQIRDQYSRRDYILSQITELPAKPTDESDEALAIKINQKNELLQKFAANKRYTELTDSVTKEKYAAENAVEVLKLLIKLTDANGLQTRLMNKPFELLSDDITTHLSTMFGRPSVAKFNMSEKANSFNFGLVRDEKYISFDTLSSGEKCLYTLALMMCIIDRTSSDLKLVIVDDLVDHLDAANAEFMFKSLSNIKDIQFILAGVQPCKLKSITVEV